MTLALLFASGAPFFTGALCCAAAVFPRGLIATRRWLPLGLMLIGLGLIVLSGTPVPFGLWGLWVVAISTWLAIRRSEPNSRRNATHIAGASVFLITAYLAVMEVRNQTTPVLPAGNARTLVVIGDSLSAGVGGGVTPWPNLLAEWHDFDVTNLAVAGATTLGAVRQALQIPAQTGVVVVLIGGNDYLQGRSSDDYSRDLQSILAIAAQRARHVVMFELPVGPLGNEYLAAQRRAAHQFNVVLVPRWKLAFALAAVGATMDGVHLSNEVAKRIASIAWETVGPAFQSRLGKIYAGSQSATARTYSLTPAPDAAQPRISSPQPVASRPAPRVLRIAAWNVQKCEGGLDAVIGKLREIDADVCCLQELIEPAAGTSGEDQTLRIAGELGMFALSDGGRLDDARRQCIAILSKAPLRQTVRLFTSPDRAYAISALVEHPDGNLRVACVHLAGTWRLNARHATETTLRREGECAALAGWIELQDEPLIVAGDFNLVSRDCTEKLGSVLHPVSDVGPTFPSSLPALSLDRVFASDDFEANTVHIDDTTISDHRPITVEFSWATARATTAAMTQPGPQ